MRFRNFELPHFMPTSLSSTVITPRRHRKDQRYDDKDLYKLRHLIENAFLKLKQWRAVATRYAKTSISFLAEGQIAAIPYGRNLL
jgi:transposase